MLLPLICAADTTVVVGQPAAVAAGCPGEYCEDFEGADNPAGWSAEAGGEDYDNTSSPLNGAQDVLLDPTEDTLYTGAWNSSELWISFRAKVNDAIDATTEDFVFFRSSGGATIGTFRLKGTANNFSCLAPAGTEVSGGSIANFEGAGQYFKLYAHSENGTSVDGIMRAWTWNGSSWDQICESLNGNQAATIDNMRFVNNATPELIQIDQFISSTSDITTPIF